MRIEPCGFKVVVKPDPVETKTESGLLLVKDEKLYRAATTKGTLIAVGPTAWKAYDNGQPWAAVGDRVYYAKYAGRFVHDNQTDEDYVILNDEDILGIVLDEEQDG